MDEHLSNGVKMSKPPGKFLAVLTGVLCLAAVFGSMNFWPAAGRIFNMLNLIICAAVPFALLIVGVFWSVKTVKFLRTEQSWSWMIAAAPAIVALGLIAALIIPQPSFERSQPKFDASWRPFLRPGL